MVRAELLLGLEVFLVELGAERFLIDLFLPQGLAFGMGVFAPELDLALLLGQTCGELLFLLLHIAAPLRQPRFFFFQSGLLGRDRCGLDSHRLAVFLQGILSYFGGPRGGKVPLDAKLKTTALSPTTVPHEPVPPPTAPPPRD